ncbi:MAG: hypothetical protein AB8B88_03675, partial [Devosiaceae bacterium]
EIGNDVPNLRVCIDRLVEGAERQIEAHCVDPAIYDASPDESEDASVALRPVFGPPDVVLLDLPAQSSSPNDPHNVKLAVYADPWPGSVDVYRGSEDQSFEFVQSVATPSITGVLLEDLAPGPVALIHHGGTTVVKVPTGALSSISHDALLNGANLAAITGPNGQEIIQFASAQLVEPGRYRINGLVRGLGGTEASAALGAPAGSRFVVLDETIEDLQVPASTLFHGTTLRAEPHDGGIGAFSRTQLSAIAMPRSLQPLAPVHAQAKQVENGDIAMQWVRRARGVADLWELPTVPLNEEAELCQITVLQGAVTVRQAEVQITAWLYTHADQVADGVSGSASSVSFCVAQIGTSGRLGQSRKFALAT